jgi:hypothetical protein
MKFRRVPVNSISNRLDETVRFPNFGTLDSDYCIKDEDDQDAAKARVQEGVIAVFAVRSDLDHDQQSKVKDMLLRSIVMDADQVNANLSIEIKPNGFDELEMRRFFERFGFRRVTDTIMKRNAGASHPASVIEKMKRAWPRVIVEALVQAAEPIPYPFLDRHKQALIQLQQQALAAAAGHIKMRLKAMQELVPGYKFKYVNSAGMQFVAMSPAIFHAGEQFDQFVSGQDVEQRYDMATQDGVQMPAGLRMVGPLIDDVMALSNHIREHFGMETAKDGGEEGGQQGGEPKSEEKPPLKEMAMRGGKA